jgi:hypothetical protein
VKLNDEMVYPWGAVDREGAIIESFIAMARGKK